ncbi:hypothetical protein P171DRAFT_432691 [Karstenula rhodostoma CBS 690.94]|uniref:Uncharacterized protein n=1 Tax=Karstenula rhodostoma CBS 690.94 TaxID=1392251 RepID=A0A9P4PG99_9PLEO|nr:hypothetical protein P171DRAFT_432691 [Karstenula rhodostoma CBS 690.94]
MPPIQLHKNAPITAAKADGITPQTAQDTPQNLPPTRTTPASIPATTTADASLPPPPQPGARPLAPTAPSNTYTPSDAPPAPQPAYTATHLTTETRLAGPPPQYSIPPPSTAQLAGRSTIPSTTASGPGPTSLDTSGGVPKASPFQQPHAGGAVSDLRNSLEHPPGYQQAPDNSPYAAGGGSLGTGGVSGAGANEGEGVGAQAWNMLSRAGEALKKGEEAVWKAVREK